MTTHEPTPTPTDDWQPLFDALPAMVRVAIRDYSYARKDYGYATGRSEVLNVDAYRADCHRTWVNLLTVLGELTPPITQPIDRPVLPEADGLELDAFAAWADREERAGIDGAVTAGRQEVHTDDGLPMIDHISMAEAVAQYRTDARTDRPPDGLDAFAAWVHAEYEGYEVRYVERTDEAGELIAEYRAAYRAGRPQASPSPAAPVETEESVIREIDMMDWYVENVWIAGRNPLVWGAQAMSVGRENRHLADCRETGPTALAALTGLRDAIRAAAQETSDGQ